MWGYLWNKNWKNCTSWAMTLSSHCHKSGNQQERQYLPANLYFECCSDYNEQFTSIWHRLETCTVKRSVLLWREWNAFIRTMNVWPACSWKLIYLTVFVVPKASKRGPALTQTCGLAFVPVYTDPNGKGCEGKQTNIDITFPMPLMQGKWKYFFESTPSRTDSTQLFPQEDNYDWSRYWASFVWTFANILRKWLNPVRYLLI